MPVLAASLFFVFAVVGGVHLLWALRIWWPISDEALLARSVVGTGGITRMPAPAITFAVVGLIALGMAWIVFLAGWAAPPLPGWLVKLGGIVMAAVLLLRGAGSYAAPLFGLEQEPEFSRLDRRWFAPLILALGAGVAVLTLTSG